MIQSMKLSEARNQMKKSQRSGAASICDHGLTPNNDVLMRDTLAAQQGDPAARERIINYTSRLVYNETRRIWLNWHATLPPQAQYDDVFMAGIEGVLCALRKYDPTKDMKLTTYSNLWIRSKAQRAVFAQLGNINLSEKTVRAAYEHDDTEEFLGKLTTLQRHVATMLIEQYTDNEIIARLELKKSEYYDLIADLREVMIQSA